MPYTMLRFEQTDHVVTITLDRPDAANALNADLARDLMHAALACDEDPDVRAVVLTGAGRMFCAGGDLKSFAAQGDALPAHLKEMTVSLHTAVSRFARMDAPLIGAVNGAAAGAGMSLACACDLVLAGESASFTMAYTHIGFTPDGSATYFLPRTVGMKRALELALTNRRLSAAEAETWGLVNRVVPDAELPVEAARLAGTLARGATSALGAAKRLLHRGWTETLETQMENEAQAIAAHAGTADGKEGLAAFLAKCAPAFRGR